MKKELIFSILLLPLLANTNITTLKANDNTIETIEPANVLNWIDSEASFYDENGLHGIRNYNESDPYANGIGIKQQFNVKNGNAKVAFQIPDYDDKTRTLLEGHVNASVPYDIYLVNVNTGFTSIFRIWSSNSSKENEQSSYIQFCETETSSWETYSGGFISGVCTNDSSFTISFDTTNYMSFNCEWKENKMTPFHELEEIGSKKEQYLNFMEKNYKNATQIELWFAHQTLEVNTKNEVVFQEINNQSFILNENKKLIDNNAPLVSDIHLTDENLKMSKNTEYTMRVEKYLNTPNTKADFYVNPTTDFGSVIDDLVASSKVKIKKENESEYSYVGEVDVQASLIKKIVFPDVGKYEMVLEVSDMANNVSLSKPLIVNVVKGYDITLLDEVKDIGKTNEEFILPLSVASDENNITREVKVVVEDPIGNEVEVKDNKFIPLTQGVYYITFYSSYIDENNVIHEAKKVVREVIIVKGQENTDTNKGCKGSINYSLISLFFLMTVVFIRKVNKNLK